MITPMRPGLILRPGIWPEGWTWQMKLDEERGVLFGDRLYNRHGAPIASHKAPHFDVAIEEVRRVWTDEPVDVGMIGFRDVSTYRDLRGCIVVYDLPARQEPWRERCKALDCLPVLPLADPQHTGSNLLFRLWNMDDAAEAYTLSRTFDGCEGIIGRDPGAYYRQGDSKAMAKCRWK